MRASLFNAGITTLLLGLMAMQPLQAVEDLWDGVFAYQKKMADYGNPEAQVKLGQMYEEGHGTAQDFAEARRWYDAAAGQGYAPAAERIAKLEARLQHNADEERLLQQEEEERHAREAAAAEEARRVAAQQAREEQERQLHEAEVARQQQQQVDREAEAQALAEAHRRAEEAIQQMLSTPEPL